MVDAVLAVPPELMAALRQAVRAELEAALPHLRAGPSLLTIHETAKKYRRGYDTIARMLSHGELMFVEKTARGGRGPQRMIVAADAERKLGGMPP
jgi:hypothetical protein